MRWQPALASWVFVLATAGCTSTAVTHQIAATNPTATSPTTAVSRSTPAVAGSSATAAATLPGPPIVGLAGAWNGAYQSSKYPNTHGTFRVTFAQTGNAVAGRVHIDSDCVGDGTVTGTMTNNHISFGVVRAAETISFDGTLTAGKLTGTYHSGAHCGDDSGSWTATRA